MLGPLDRLWNKRTTSHGALAVVTGAGSGIGAAFAVELGRRGGTVVCSDIDEAAAQRTVDEILDLDAKAIAVRCDVSRFDDVADLAQQAQAFFGAPPTLVINNAGVAVAGAAIGEVPMDDWAWLLNVNLWGPIHGCHVFAPLLRDAPKLAAPRGIINVASAAAYAAAPGMGPYNVSKAGVLSLSETLAAELSGSRVKVTALCPTFVKTNIVDSGRITTEYGEAGGRFMRWIGRSPHSVARTCLDTHDRGALYCLPQIEAKIGWSLKRLAPQTTTRAAGAASRTFGP